MRNKSHHAKAAFSLIELLTVMVILTVLLMAAIPIFADSSVNASRLSREIVKTQLQQARAHAIASGVSTAVAIPILDSGKTLGACAISLFEVEKTGLTYTPVKNAQDESAPLQRWEILPGNFHFLSASSVSSRRPTLVDSPDFMEWNSKEKTIICHIIVFAPNGQIVLPTTEVDLALGQAVYRGRSLVLSRKSEGKPVFDLIQVNRLTGHTHTIQP